METSFYSEEELKGLGFKSVGSNVLISKKASFYGVDQIVIGNHVRVDDFCILSGNIKIGNYIHIAAYTALYGGCAGIVLEDFAGISSRCAVYALSDDVSGESMVGPMVLDKYRGVRNEKVIIRKHANLFTGSTVLPGVTIGEGTVVGSMSLVNKSLDEWGIYVGIPCKRKKERSKKILELEQKMMEEE